jgi:hypothetical protein
MIKSRRNPVVVSTSDHVIPQSSHQFVLAVNFVCDIKKPQLLKILNDAKLASVKSDLMLRAVIIP